MPRPAIALVLAALALAGCDAATTRATMEGLTWDYLSTNTAFGTEEAAFEVPFTRGVIAIVATERGELRTYRLYPCLSGAGVCLNSPQGPASAVQRGQRHYIVAGPAGRTFFLPQGDVPLSWNAYINGIPAWPGPIGVAVPRSEPSQSAFRP